MFCLLSLAELRCSTSCLQAVLLTFFHSRISCKISVRLQNRSVISVYLKKCSCDTVSCSTCLTGETTAFTPVDKTFFRNGDILAVEVQHPGAVKYQTKLAGLFVDQQADNKSKLDVSVTLFGRDADAEGESTEAVGYVFFIQVPNNVDKVSITEAFRVEG